MKRKVNYCFIVLVAVLSSCGSSRNLVYFSDLRDSEEFTIAVKESFQTRIQSKDLLDITVSSLNPEANALFNGGVISKAGMNATTPTATKANEGYLVDENGFVNFPVIGKIQLAGLTTAEATEKMTNELKQHVKNPIINLRFLNFKITVVGEVNRPSSFVVPTDKINIIEALGLAGDMTVFGKRDNVLIIREKDGVRTTTRVNLNNKSLLNSPYFYLAQNDIVYVEPVKAKGAQASLGQYKVSIVLSVISILSIILVRFI